MTFLSCAFSRNVGAREGGQEAHDDHSHRQAERSLRKGHPRGGARSGVHGGGCSPQLRQGEDDREVAAPFGVHRRARTLIKMYEEEGISKDRILIKVRLLPPAQC